MKPTLERLLAGHDLDEAEALQLATALTAGEIHPALAGGTLAALRAKGETTAEVRGFARALQARAIRVEVPRMGAPLVDTAGTGGDGSNSLNLSTASALVAAAAGCRVVKHGNRSLSSKCGSADVLEAAGIGLSESPSEAQRQLAETGFTFLFAPAFHPALKTLGEVRRALGVRTVFNLLGPLLNPAGPDAQIIGVATDPVGHLIARAAAGLSVPRVFVVHGANGWDEPTPIGPFKLWTVIDGHVQVEFRDPAPFGLARCRPEDLRGGDPATNAARLTAVLTNQERGPHRDAVILGAALTLEVAGVETSPANALLRAEAAITNGATADLLARLQGLNAHPPKIETTEVMTQRPVVAPSHHGALARFVRDSELRVKALPTADALAQRLDSAPRPRPLPNEAFGLIAEVKFRAPSATGALGDASPSDAVRRAEAYADGGASAISVLTCPEGFDGHIDHLTAVAKSVDVPVMRKDFLVDPVQVFEARLAGASGVLLIARILDDLPAMLEAAAEAGLFSLVEIFDEDDLARLPSTCPSEGSVLVGVNARCLDTLKVVPDRHRQLHPRLPAGLATVAESGLHSAEDAARVAADGYDLALVGTALMLDAYPRRAVAKMIMAGQRAKGVELCA